MVRIYILLFAILVTSCTSYKELTIDVLKPAQYTIPPEIKSVVIVNNSEPYRSSKAHEVLLQGEKQYVDSIFYYEFAIKASKVLQEELSRRSFFDTVIIHSEKLPDHVFNKKSGLPLTYVNTLCKKYNADAVISLEDYLYKSKLQFSVDYEGKVFGDFDFNSSILWRFSDNINNKILKQVVQNDTIYWQETGGGYNSVASELPDYDTALRDLAVYMGVKAADYYAPTWIQEKRGLYSANMYEFVQAMDHVRTDNWGEAIKLWKSVYDRGKSKNKFMAAFNLSVASEILGDYTSTQIWISRAGDIIMQYPSHKAVDFKSRYANHAYNFSQRLKSIKKLKEQIGGE